MKQKRFDKKPARIKDTKEANLVMMALPRHFSTQFLCRVKEHTSQLTEH